MKPKSLWLPKYEQIIWELYNREDQQNDEDLIDDAFEESALLNKK